MLPHVAAKLVCKDQRYEAIYQQPSYIGGRNCTQPECWREKLLAGDIARISVGGSHRNGCSMNEGSNMRATQFFEVLNFS